MPLLPVVSVALRREQDLLLVRQRARQICQFLGFSSGDITRVTTALSEIGRNALEYADAGRVEFAIGSAADGQEFVVVVKDGGDGIPDLADVLASESRTRTGTSIGIRGGIGGGIRGSRALMDRSFDVSHLLRGPRRPQASQRLRRR